MVVTSTRDHALLADGRSLGTVSRFNDVKKKQREKTRSKPANETTSSDADQFKTATSRGGRGRANADGARGGRARGSERGRGGARGGRGGSSAVNNDTRNVKASATATDSAGWDNAATNTTTGAGWDQPSTDTWVAEQNASEGWDDTNAPAETKPATANEPQKSSIIPEGTTKSWASMLSKPKPAPAMPKTAPTAASGMATVNHSDLEQNGLNDSVPTVETTDHDNAGTGWDTSQANDDAFAQNETTPMATKASITDSSRITSESLPPSKDSLTENNVENLPDQSGPPTSETVASQRGAHSALEGGQSLAANQQAPIARPGLGGFATSAQKAAGQGRTSSFQKLKEQQDAVVMPGKHPVDRTAVQFGSMNLGGDERPLDVQEEREDAETRTQPPQQSPSQPRASLPPAPRSQQAPVEPTGHESLAGMKQAPGLPHPSQQQMPPVSQSPQVSGVQNLNSSAMDSAPYNQYGGRYGGSAFGQEHGAPPQKAYDPFSSQLYPQSQTEPQSMYSGASQAPGQLSQPATSQAGNYSHMQSDYNSHYPSESTRGSYSNYYGSYNQPSASLQENVAPQRSTSGFGAGEAGLGGNHSSQHQSRFGESQASGNNTPNPPMGSQQHATSQSHQSQHMPQQGHGHSGFGGHPYGGGYGHSGYYQQFGNQGYANYYGYNQHGYGGPYGGKGGMYGGGPGHHGYGMSSHTSYDTASSPATAGAFGGTSLPGRESSMSSGLNDFPRAGSAQPPSQSQQAGNNNPGFGSMGDSYGRSSSGFGTHGQGFGAPSSGANEESIKSLHDSKTGPSPLGQAGRPGSGFNANPGGPGYGPPGNQQGAFGGSGYPGHLGGLHSQYGGSGYGGMGGLGNHGASHGNQSGYGNYGSGFGNSSYGGRGGWGGQYGGQYSGH